MNRRASTATALAVAALSFGVLRAEPAAAQYSRDRAARREITKAISRHYLAMRFDAAEKRLLGVVKSCKKKCRPLTVAEAWMYVGVVRGSGKEDLDAARQAFDTALSIDPQVALDDALATAETQATYQAALDARDGKTQAVPPIDAPTSNGSSAAAAAPTTDREPPPARSDEPVLCPPDFPGCEDTMGDESTDVDADPAPSYERDRIGLHFAADFGFIQGANVCATSNESFECFTSGADGPYPAELPPSLARRPGELGDPYPGTGIQSGAAGGTMRALFSYDHAFSERISAGLRLGYAFGGGPSSLGGRSFLPLHAEGRLQYWLRGLSAKGLQPYLNVGGGVAQVDIEKTGVTVRDCSEESARQAFLDCIDARNAYDSGNDPVLPTRTLDSYRKLGNAFASAGAGVLIPLGGKVDVQLNLSAMLMVPSVGLVLQPSIGLGYSL